MPDFKCICESHECAPGCDCGYSDAYHRFTVQRITEYSPNCIRHGYMFKINLADDLRYGD